MNQELLPIEIVENINELDNLEIGVINEEKIFALEGKYLLFLNSVREAKFRTILFLWKKQHILDFKYKLAKFIDSYSDDDIRIKRLLIQYLNRVGNHRLLREILSSASYSSLEDAAIEKILQAHCKQFGDLEESTGEIAIHGSIILNVPSQNEAPSSRGVSRVEDEYKKTWDAEVRRINRCSHDGAANSLAMLYLKAYEALPRWGLLGDAAIGELLRKDFMDADLPFNGIETAYRIGVCGENYQIISFQSAISSAKKLIEAGKVDVVVELGSGSSSNLFHCFHALDFNYRDNVTFIGAEFTEQGRKAADLIHSLQPDMNFKSVAFNYYEPDFSFLNELKSKNVFFFSNHSIEQIPLLPASFFKKMITETNDCYCVHNEPVGWQLLPALVEARKNMDRAFFAKIKDNMTTQPIKTTVQEEEIFGRRYSKNIVSYNSAWWSYHKSYNTNLISLLKALEAQGDICLKKIVKHHTAGNLINNIVGNPLNPSTFIEWQKK
ncbi:MULTISPECIES: hypothetical protein [unclassified Pseudovibrio]|uniref:hypothetical protein n=1 Tax=unclassified Pseudovibrio TaxID=2627060 RepID=UPI0007AE7A31|nr:MULTISPECIES: hypothetical protein [unclassified Pseudovibrio]KZK99996.1 hypothetical protein PsW74_02612 [Pseudovibrio sp. W74]KZL11826.1 hypothetical protein PsAD14_00742 [Pseudovibrio sp. Ad14]